MRNSQTILLETLRPPAHWLKWLTSLLLITLVFAANASENTNKIALTVEEREWLKQNPHIKLSVAAELPSHAIQYKGHGFTGVLPSIFDLLSRSIGQKIGLVSARLDTAKEEIYGNSAILKTALNDSDYLLTDPYVSTSYYLITTLEKRSQIKAPDGLKGKKIAVLHDHHAIHSYLDAFDDIEKIVADGPLDQLHKVSTGEADALVGHKYHSHLIGKHRIANLAIADIIKEGAQVRVGVNLDHPVLLRILNKAIASLNEKQMAGILSKWTQITRHELPKIELTGEELNWLATHRTLRVAPDPDYPPLEFFDEHGRYQGMVADYLRLITERLGVRLDVVRTDSWPQAIEALRNGDADLIGANAADEQSLRGFLFTDSLYSFDNVILSHSGTKQEVHPEDLSGKQVLVVKNCALANIFRVEFPEITLVEVDSALDGLTKISTREYDYFLSYFPVASYLISEHGLRGIHVVGKSSEPDGNTMMVRKKSKMLHQVLQKALASITPEEHSAIRSKWTTLQSTPADQTTFSSGIVLAFLAAGLFVFSCLAFLMLRLSRKTNLTEKFGSTSFRRTTVVFQALFVLVVLALAWWLLEYNREKMLDVRQGEISTVLSTTHERLHVWKDTQQLLLRGLAEDTQLIAATEQLLAISATANKLETAPALLEVRALHKKHFAKFNGIDFFIISPDRISIASMSDSGLGSIHPIERQSPDLLNRAFQGETVWVPPVFRDTNRGDQASNKLDAPPSLFFATPIRNQQGEVIAVLVKEMDAAHSFSSMLELGQYGNSGESYVFDQNGRLLSGSRFNDHLIQAGLLESGQSSSSNIEIRDPGGDLTNGFRPSTPRDIQPLTRMAASAVLHESGVDMTGYRDYRGVSVIGTWLWDEQLSLGLATEIDKDEAYAAFNFMRWSVFAVLALTLIIAVGGTTFALLLGGRAASVLRRSRDELETQVYKRTQALEKEVQERRKVERESVTLQRAMNESLAGVLIADIDGIVTYTNQAFTKATGVEAGRGLGQSATQFMKSEANIPAAVIENCVRTLENDEDWQGEFHANNAKGEKYWMFVTVARVRDDNGKITHYVAVQEDITELKRAGHELQQFKTTLDQTKDAVFVFSPYTLKFLYVNHSAIRELGYSSEEFLTMTPLDIKPEFSPEQFRTLIEPLFNREQMSITFETVHRHKDGHDMPVEISLQYLAFSDGSAEYVGVARNITERRALQTELERQKTLLDMLHKVTTQFVDQGDFSKTMNSMLDTLLELTESEYGFTGEVFFDDNGAPYLRTHAITDISWSPETQALYDKGTVEGFEFHDLNTLFGHVMTSGEVVLSNQPDRDPRAGGLPVGHPPLLSFLGVPISYGGQLVGIYAIANRPGGYDKQLLHFLRPFDASYAVMINSMRVLEKEEEHRAALVEARDSAEHANQAKSDFLSSMSHELRTPLNAILGFAQLFDYDRSLTAVQKSNAKEIYNSGNHLLSLVDEVLDLSKIESGHMELSMESVSIPAIMDDCCTLVETFAAEHEVTLDFTPSTRSEVFVKADYLRLKQVLLNLLSNAIKYNIKGGRVEVFCTWRDTDSVQINVRDTGQGISQSWLQSLFQPFNRLGAAASKTQGTGIGLVITKQLVELMEGVIGVESALDEGSTFWVEFKSGRQTETQSTDSLSASTSDAVNLQESTPSEAKILIAEDNIINQKVLSQQLSVLGYQADFADNGMIAWEQWQAVSYDILLTDISMPLLDGYGLVERIRNAEKRSGTHMPIIAITGNAMDDDIKRCMEKGMDGFVSKPVEISNLKNTLKNWLPKHLSIDT